MVILCAIFREKDNNVYDACTMTYSAKKSIHTLSFPPHILLG